MDDVLIVISHYSARDKTSLMSLIQRISAITSNILIVINDDSATVESFGRLENFPVITRPNTGMNIGGWNSAYQSYRNYNYYIFMQDECSLMRDDFIAAYMQELSAEGVGMTGESINFKWDKSWAELLHSPLNYFTDICLNGRRLSRVENYLGLIRHWGINPGEGGRHLRSLVWGFNQNALRQIGGFPEGRSKEECIASEISVSKKIEELGLRVTQISKTPFSFFKHQEWRSDGHSKI
jgi:hypothetical protein